MLVLPRQQEDVCITDLQVVPPHGEELVLLLWIGGAEPDQVEAEHIPSLVAEEVEIILLWVQHDLLDVVNLKELIYIELLLGLMIIPDRILHITNHKLLLVRSGDKELGLLLQRRLECVDLGTLLSLEVHLKNLFALGEDDCVVFSRRHGVLEEVFHRDLVEIWDVLYDDPLM